MTINYDLDKKIMQSFETSHFHIALSFINLQILNLAEFF
jgi:hypothetical protein